MIYQAVKELALYGIEKGLIQKGDEIFVINRILETLGLNNYQEPKISEKRDLEQILKELLDYACEKGIIEDSIIYRDLFDTKLMGILTPFPHEVIDEFSRRKEESPEAATDWYYDFSQATDYIRSYRIKKDLRWKTATEYGDLDITINLSKPEKDPKAIAAAKNTPKGNYPQCMLCKENEGYSGRVDHPARQNHRVIPIKIADKDWFFQYSPYVYYNEHCIAFNCEHVPMKIDRSAFEKMFDFIQFLPHYFIGSNADLPIVGGSILAHDHFQGGRYTFAMELAEIEKNVLFNDFEDVEAGIVKWPMSVIRLRCADRERIIDLADKILAKWRGYTDEEAFIFAETDGESHNTITPIARKRDGKFELDLVLRNNITTKEHPLGVYHPHAKLHHIKKENIGLIEVMGLAVLPARLLDEMEAVKEFILTGKDMHASEKTAIHADWAEEFMKKYGSVSREELDKIIEYEIGIVFSQVLEDAGVYKRTEEGIQAFCRFLKEFSCKF
ncbi:galactose-1-phosphate uridylyltransferase [Clostridiales bacterium]|nr:galactose-1-phosphate uridylyltransferase [Clostridiales bacterium]